VAKCDIIRESAEDLDALEKIIKEGTIEESDIYDFQKVMEDINAELAVKNLIGDVVDEKDIAEFIKEKYGEHWERYLLATKIVALTSANPIISSMVQEYIYLYQPTATGKTSGFGKGEMIEGRFIDKTTGEERTFGTGGLTYEEYSKLSKEEKLKQSLKVMSKNDLSVIYSKVYNWATADTGHDFGKGVVGNFVTQFFGGKQVGQKERSGAYYKFASHITKYYTMIENDIGNFMYRRTAQVTDPDTGEKVPKQFQGMDDVFNEVQNLSRIVKGWKLKKGTVYTKKEIMTEFFTMIMTGEIYWDKKNKKFMGFLDLGLIPDKTTQSGYAEYPDGSLKHNFSNPVSLFTDKGGVNREFYGGRYAIPLKPANTKKLLTQVNKAREIDDRVYKYSKKKFIESVNKLISSLEKHFPDLSKEEVKTLLFEEYKVIKHKKILDKLRKIDKDHKKTYIKTYNTFKGTFSKYASIKFFLNQANDSEYKKNHWPIMYSDQTFKIMWDNRIVEYEDKIKGIKKKIAAEKDQAKIDKMNEQVETLENQVIIFKDIINKKDGLYPTDTIRQVEMPLARDHRYLKRITNSFDIRLGRKDTGVYYDYLNNIMGAINRNLLTVTLLDSLLLSKSEAVDEALINYYKVPFNDPSVVGGIGPLKWSDEGISTSLKGIGMNVDPDTVNRSFRRLNKWLTAAFLGGVSTAWVNRLAIVQTMQDRNYNSIIEANDYWAQNEDEINAFIKKSGVAAFQDFFSQSLINGKAGFEVDIATAERLYAVMLNYPTIKDNLRNMSNSKLRAIASKNNIETKDIKREELIDKLAEAELYDNFGKVLKDSPAWHLQIKKKYTKGEVKSRLKQMETAKWDSMLDKYVQYTLTQEVEMNKFAMMIDWKYTNMQKIAKWGLKGTYATAKGLGKLRKAMKSTMSDSEAWIRTLTFLVAVMQAQKLGYVRSDVQLWELTGKDLEIAMEIGRMASVYSNMGLSATDVGASAWGGMGNYMQKFNYWGIQKRGRDYRVVKNAIIIQQSLLDLGKKNPFFDPKAVAKMIGKSVSKWPQTWNYNKMNLAEKQQAQMLKFLSIGVLPALVLDLIVWGPLGNIIGFNVLKFALRRTGGAGAIRGLPSQMAQLITVPLAMIIKMSLGMIDDDEEEEIMQFITQYTRTLPFGYGVNWSFNWISFLYMIMSENVPAATTSAFDILRPLSPGHGVHKTLQYPVDALMKMLDD
tara:strand:+ start:1574 stop:5194 length:3621 start_codon:yes stop_codon:yes gene_type:complete